MTSFAVRRIHSFSGPAIGALALVSSAWFVARTVHTLGRGAAAPAIVEPTPAPVPPPTPPPRPPRDGAALVARNMFCASCTDAPPPPDRGTPGVRRFTARLIATSVESPTRGAATLHDPTTGAAGWFPLGAIAPGGARIIAVRRDAIDVRFPDDAVETVALDGEHPAEPPPPKVAPSSDTWGDRVRSLGDDRWEVDRGLIGELVGGGASAQVPGVRLAPVAVGGKLTGIKVASARAGSLARTLGLEPGDVIEAIDGQPIDSAKMLMDLYGQLDQRKRVELTVKRAGASRTLRYELR